MKELQIFTGLQQQEKPISDEILSTIENEGILEAFLRAKIKKILMEQVSAKHNSTKST